MRKLIVHELMTLDGIMQAPGGPDEDRDGGFAHGGCTLPYWHDDIGASFGALMQDVDAFLLGRKTYVTHGLVDELMLHVDPVAFGKGKRVFPDTGIDARFTLAKTTPYPPGVVGLHYTRAA